MDEQIPSKLAWADGISMLRGLEERYEEMKRETRELGGEWIQKDRERWRERENQE